MRLLHVIGASSLALLAVSCSLGESSDASSINVYVSVDKSTLPLDESMTITVNARNVGYDALTLTGPSDCLLFVEILNNTGLVLWSSDNGCAPGSVTETLEPGQQKVQTFTWSGTNQGGTRLPSGVYRVRAVARLTGASTAGPVLSVLVE